MKIKSSHITYIKKICAELNVKIFAAFGSVSRDDFREDSYIGFVVDFNEQDPFTYTDLYFSLKEHLEKLFKRKIDLAEDRAIKNNSFRKQLDKTKVHIYGA